MAHFAKDLEDLRYRAEQKMEEGAVTQSYKGDVKKAIEILNEALATEIVCVLRYMHHYFMATGVHGKGVSDEFKEHADAEREHADLLAERIQQLGGKPDFNPKNLVERSVTQYVEGETLADMIREDLIAERIVIEVYQDMIRYFGNNDPTTRVILEKLLHDEEEHADDLADLLYIVNPETAQTEGLDPGTEPLRMHQSATDGGARSQTKQRTVREIAQTRDQAVERSNARLAEEGGRQHEMKEAQGRTTPAQSSGEEVIESHKRDRQRILNELRWMGKNKKKKPAA
jgi:bacterioferritin